MGEAICTTRTAMFADSIRFADILSPVTPEEFFAAYHDTKPLLVPGRRDKAAGIMSWDRLNALLGMTGSVKWVISRTVDNKRSSKT